MKKTMEWTDPVITKLSENQGASGAFECKAGGNAAAPDCHTTGIGATSSCDEGLVPGASGTACWNGDGGDGW